MVKKKKEKKESNKPCKTLKMEVKTTMMEKTVVMMSKKAGVTNKEIPTMLNDLIDKMVNLKHLSLKPF